MQLHSWCKANLMIVNPSKSKCMLLTCRQKRQNLPNTTLDIYFNDILIPSTDTHKLLGIVIDNNLSWVPCIKTIIRRISIHIYQMNCIKFFLDEKSRKLFYTSYIQSIIDYCSTIWGKCASCHIQRLFSLQRRAMKIIKLQKKVTLSTFQELNIMPLSSRLTLNTNMYTHKIMYESVPGYLKNVFHFKNIHYGKLASLLIIPKPNLDLYKCSFSYCNAKFQSNADLKRHLNSSVHRK